ncbi:hypothetical protein Taro_052181 [Colocasia esculenta]|uniref:Uncharacterized protein n=1 Tax=Colocasia esculenta TaxID=4460 RepID=A0A843XIW4_COLES|nr:hypothetical protein [Colocasia esculenta]
MVITYGPLVVNNYARFGYLATPIVFGDFPAIVGSPYFLGVVPAQQEKGVAQKSPSNKSTKKTGRIHGHVKARPATVNRGTQMPSKDDVAKGAKPHPTQMRSYSVQWQSEMAMLLNEMRRLTTSSLRQSMEPASIQNQQQSQHPDGSAPADTLDHNVDLPPLRFGEVPLCSDHFWILSSAPAATRNPTLTTAAITTMSWHTARKYDWDTQHRLQMSS